MVSETRRSQPNPENGSLAIAFDATTMARPAAVPSNLLYIAFKLGFRNSKPDEKTGKHRLYSDVVTKAGNWLLSQ